MPKHPGPDTPAPDEIPELEDVVAAPPASEAVPPPNLDLFGAPGPGLDAVRDALAARLGEEIDAALADLRAEFEETLRHRVEARLRDRLPEIIDAALAAPAPPE